MTAGSRSARKIASASPTSTAAPARSCRWRAKSAARPPASPSPHWAKSPPVSAATRPDTRAKLEQARKKIDARLTRSVTAHRFDGRDLGEGIGQAVSEVVPLVIGDIVGGAVRAALSGDSQRLEQMEGLDKQIEARIEPRAKALEARAERMCAKMATLDRFDNALAYRLPGGAALDLLRMKPEADADSEK